MASITKRRTQGGKVTWQVRWRTGGRGSKAKAKTFGTLASARIFAAQTETTQGDQTSAAAAALGDLTFADYRTRWLSEQAQLTKASGTGTASLSSNSLDVYKRCTAHMLEPLGHIPIAGITRGDITNALRTMATQRAKATVQVTRAALAKMFEQLESLGVVEQSPVPTGRQLKLPSPKTPRGSPKAYSPDQVRALVQAAADYGTRALVQILASTGMRRGEALGLQWRHLNLGNEPMLHIEQTVIKQGNDVIVQRFGKTAQSTRSFALSIYEAGILRVLYDYRITQTKYMRDRWTPSAFVWPRSAHKLREPMNPEYCSVKLRRLRDAIGASTGISPAHGLRHAAITQMVNNGIPPQVVARRVGHASPQQTLNTYSHSSDDDLIDAAQRMGDIWQGVMAGNSGDPFGG